MTRDINGREIDLEDLGLCEYAAGTDLAVRHPDACPREATVITEEGYRYCFEHAKAFYELAAVLDRAL